MVANLILEPTFLQAVTVLLIYGINTVPALRPGPAFIVHLIPAQEAFDSKKCFLHGSCVTSQKR